MHERGDDAKVGLVASAKDKGGFFPQEAGQTIFQFLVQV
jgi:hypothetical protein